MRILAPLLLLLLGAACTDAALYGDAVPLAPDEVRITGSLCTADPTELRFPVKVLLLVDTSVGEGDYVAQRGASLERLLQSWSGANTSFGVIRYAGRAGGSGGSSSRPPCSLENLTPGGFTRNLEDAILGVQCTDAASGSRDWASAISLANSIITGDVLSADPGLRSRTKYVVAQLTNGAPTISLREVWCGSRNPALTGEACTERYEEAFCEGMQPPPADCERAQYARSVRDMKAFAENNGAQELHFHAIYQRDPDRAMDPAQGDDEAALALLGEMTLAGGGTLSRFGGPGSCSNASGGAGCLFSSVDLASTEAVFLRREFMVSNRNALAGPDGSEPDSDGDGLADRVEIALGTSPVLVDTDGDHLSDRLEHLLRSEGLDPLRDDLTDPAGNWPLECPLPGSGNPNAFPPDQDRDGDRLTDCEENLLRSESSLFDSDADGIADSLEFRYGTNLIAADRMDDVDADGFSNVDEYRTHRDPLARDRSLDRLYRTDITNERLASVVAATQPWGVTGVSILSVTGDVAEGRGTVYFEPPGDPSQPVSAENPARLSWRAPMDETPSGADPGRGAGVVIHGDGRYVLQSAATSEEAPAAIEVEIYAAMLPRAAARDDVRLHRSERTCFDFRVRNVRLLPTLALPEGTAAGTNYLDVFLAEVPSNHPAGAGIFRVATIPVVYRPEASRGREIVLEERELLLFGE